LHKPVAFALVTTLLSLSLVVTLARAPAAFTATGQATSSDPTLLQDSGLLSGCALPSCFANSGSKVASGDLLVVAGFYYAGSAIPFGFTVTDNISSSWNVLPPECIADGTYDECALIAYAEAPTTAWDQVTMTVSGGSGASASLGMVLEEWEGLSSPYVVYQSIGSCTNSCGAATSHGSITFNSPSYVALAALEADYSTSSVLAGGSYVLGGFGRGAEICALEYSTTVGSNATGPFGITYAAARGWVEVGAVIGQSSATTSSTTTATEVSNSFTTSTGSHASTTLLATTTSQTTTSSSSPGGGGGIPEFPLQLLALAAFTILLVASYVLIGHRSSRRGQRLARS
jgi:hypothetical protein